MALSSLTSSSLAAASSPASPFTHPLTVLSNSTTSTSSTNPSSGTASASLYLYTFLATLILLLSVAASIIARSLVLRRRHRRTVEEAVRNGTWVESAARAGSGGCSVGVDPAQKPNIWDAYISNPAKDNLEKAEKEAKWNCFKPLSAAYIPSPDVPASATASSPQPNALSTTLSTPLTAEVNPVPGYTASEFDATRQPQQQGQASPSIMHLLSRLVNPTPVTSSSWLPSHSAQHFPEQPMIDLEGQRHLQMTVLIAMPTNGDTEHSSSEIEQLPYVEMGIADLPVLLPKTLAEKLTTDGGDSENGSIESLKR